MKESRKIRALREDDHMDDDSDQARGAERSKEIKAAKKNKQRRQAGDSGVPTPLPAVETPAPVVAEREPTIATTVVKDESIPQPATTLEDSSKTQPISVKELRQEQQKKKTTLEKIMGGFPKEIRDIVSKESDSIKSEIQKLESDNSTEAKRKLKKLRIKLSTFENDPLKYYRVLMQKAAGSSRDELEKVLRSVAKGLGIKEGFIQAVIKTPKARPAELPAEPATKNPPVEVLETKTPVVEVPEAVAPTPDIATPEIHTEPVEPTPDTQTAEKEAKLKRIEALKQKERELEETLRLLTEQVEALPDNEIEEIKSEEALELERGIAELQTSIEKKRKEKEGTWGIRKFKHNRLEGEIKTLQEKLAMKNEILSGYLLREKEKAQRKLVGRNSKK